MATKQTAKGTKQISHQSSHHEAAPGHARVKEQYPSVGDLGIQSLHFVKDLDPLNPSPNSAEHRRNLLAIYFETGGSRAGLAIAEAWNRNGKGCTSIADLLYLWARFDSI